MKAEEIQEESDDPVHILTMRSRDRHPHPTEKMISRLAKVKMILDNKPSSSYRSLPRAVEEIPKIGVESTRNSKTFK